MNRTVRHTVPAAILTVLAAISLGIFLFYAGCFALMFGCDHSFTTEQGDSLNFHLAGAYLTITEPNEELPPTCLYVDDCDTIFSQVLAKWHFKFEKEEHGCRFYSIDGEEYIFYTAAAPHVLTEDGHWYQLRFVDEYDALHCRYIGTMLYAVEYAHSNGSATEPISSHRIGTLDRRPECTTYDLVHSLQTPAANLSDLLDQLKASALISLK